MSVNQPNFPPTSGEQVAVSNRFGTVSNLAVHYNVKKGLLGGTRREDLTMRHIVAARLETSRHPIWGGLLGLIGLSCLFGGLQAGGGSVILAFILLALAVLLLWGSPRVSITAADGGARPSVGWPWTRGEAREFVDAVSRELMSRG